MQGAGSAGATRGQRASVETTGGGPRRAYTTRVPRTRDGRCAQAAGSEVRRGSELDRPTALPQAPACVHTWNTQAARSSSQVDLSCMHTGSPRRTHELRHACLRRRCLGHNGGLCTQDPARGLLPVRPPRALRPAPQQVTTKTMHTWQIRRTGGTRCRLSSAVARGRPSSLIPSNHIARKWLGTPHARTPHNTPPRHSPGRAHTVKKQ